MGKRLAFGTSGLRGAMGAGSSRMNDLVVIQTTQGLCRYLEEEGGQGFKQRGVVIGRDHRRQGGLCSEGFADLATAVFVSRGFRVFLMRGTVATPLVAFGVSHLKACAGIMVTASHNPKKDNGYKVYWGNGSQIIPPHDVGIAASIARNLEPWQIYDPAVSKAGPLCSDPTDSLTGAYFTGIREGLCRRPEANARSGLEVVYSAMHGVGHAWARQAFLSFSLPPFLSVSSQQDPDPEFPTVAFPNPEEQGALEEAMLLADERGVPLVLANDPDGDRLAAAERQRSGDWRIFSGNEIGVLLGLWQWEEWRRTHPDEDASKAVMIASTVSSKMLSAAARLEGFTFEETLPGFKWMGHRAQELKAEGKTVLFAYEEAIGFGPGDVVFEKDGLSSAALFAEMVVALRERDDVHGAHEAATRMGSAHGQDMAPSAAATAAAATLPTIASATTNLRPIEMPAVNHDERKHPVEAPVKDVYRDARMVSTAPASPYMTGVPSPLHSPAAVNDMFSLSSSLSSPMVSSAQPPWSPGEPVNGRRSDASRGKEDEAEGGRTSVRSAQHQEETRFSSILCRRLRALHGRYGEFAEENGYVRCEDKEVVSKIFTRLRGVGTYRSLFGSYKVTAVRDLAEGHGFDSEKVDNKPSLPLVGGGAHFLTFTFGDDAVVATLRTSGTEPKIKFYLEKQGRPGVPLSEVCTRLSELAAVFIDDALQPDRWGITRVALA